MSTDVQVAALASLDFLPYLTEAGEVIDTFAGKVGVYAIFDQAQTLQYIGYSRDVSLSLRQHIVRCPYQCHWLKVQAIAKPSRTLLEEIRTAWIAENGSAPVGNSTDEATWTQPIDAKLSMTEDEKATYDASDELGKLKTLKQIARRVEADVNQTLASRGVTTPFRFDPKLKEQGLLSLK